MSTRKIYCLGYLTQLFLFSSYIFLLTFLSSSHTAEVVHAQAYVATTTVSLTVCGDGIVADNEFCDDGVLNNTGAYGFSIATRHCNSTCTAWGQYCGDAVMQTQQGEECDDGDNFAGDGCDTVCQNEYDPVVVGGGGGDGGSGGGGGKGSGQGGIPGASVEGGIEYEGDTDLNINGLAYPGATITVLRDGEIERVIEANSTAGFSFTLTDQTPGITTLGFWAVDRAGRRSVTYAATFQVIENAVTTLSGILIPPTLAVTPEKAPQGTTISFEGSALPSTKLQTFVDDGTVPEETIVATNGEWKVAYDTSGLTNESFHTVKANYLDVANPQLKSGYSLLTNFYIGNRDVNTGLTADLNSDGAVNITDFSILLFHWNTTNAVADINGDGSVSLADFSIMLFYWTG